jgi:hypothetical protein
MRLPNGHGSPGAGLISTAPTGGSVASSLIAAASVLARPAYPYRKRENRKSGAKQTHEGLVAELALKPFGIFPHQLSVGDGKELREYAIGRP